VVTTGTLQSGEGFDAIKKEKGIIIDKNSNKASFQGFYDVLCHE